MSIGETLAQSRQRAGLSVAQVSELTRIRETIIRGVEDDDYSACGGDFYARGHIRAIAKAVGTDPGPLIREYDGGRRTPGAVSTVSLQELLATSAHSPQQRRPDLPAVWALVASAYASARRRVKLPTMRELAARAPHGPGRRVNWAVALGLALAVVLGFEIYRVLSGSPYAAVARPAAGNRAEAGNDAAAGNRVAAGNHAAAGNRAAAGNDVAAGNRAAAGNHAAAGPHPWHSTPKTSHAGAAPSTAPAVLAQAPPPAHAAPAGRGTPRQSPARLSGDQRSSSGDQRSSPGRPAHRRLRQRPLREPVPGHAPAAGHGPDGRGHQRAHQPRRGLRHRFPAAGRHQARAAGKG